MYSINQLSPNAPKLNIKLKLNIFDKEFTKCSLSLELNFLTLKGIIKTATNNV